MNVLDATVSAMLRKTKRGFDVIYRTSFWAINRCRDFHFNGFIFKLAAVNVLVIEDKVQQKYMYSNRERCQITYAW